MMILSIDDPGPTVPHFEVGETVRAPNGQIRMIKSMRWSYNASSIRTGTPPHLQPKKWGWVVTTVPPGEPQSNDTGEGFEVGYSKL